jgi:hypothetical protein
MTGEIALKAEALWRGYLSNKFRKFFRGWFKTVWDIASFLLPLLPPGVGGITGYLAHYWDKAPLYVVVFYSIGAFGFCALGLAALQYFIRHRTVHERLRYVGTEPIIVRPRPDESMVDVIFKCKLMNMSTTRSIYVALRRGDAHLQGRTNPDPALQDETVIVPPFSDFAITIAPVPNINASQEIKGRLEVEIAYGSSPHNLDHLLAYEIAPMIQIRNLTKEKAEILFVGPVKKYRHKRV